MALAVGLIVGAGGVSVGGGSVAVGVGDGWGEGLDEIVGEGSGDCEVGVVRPGSGAVAGMVRALTGPPGYRSRVDLGEQLLMKAAIASADSTRARVRARAGLSERCSRLCGYIQMHPKDKLARQMEVGWSASHPIPASTGKRAG